MGGVGKSTIGSGWECEKFEKIGMIYGGGSMLKWDIEGERKKKGSVEGKKSKWLF